MTINDALQILLLAAPSSMPAIHTSDWIHMYSGEVTRETEYHVVVSEFGMTQLSEKGLDLREIVHKLTAAIPQRQPKSEVVGA